MEHELGSFSSVVRRPSAFLPMAMSVAALGVVMVQLATSGAARQPDEGAAAHLWQILMAGQAPILVFFAIKWLPRAPRQSLDVLALQVVAVLAAAAPVYFLHW
jgi:hypothetical protein